MMDDKSMHQKVVDQAVSVAIKATDKGLDQVEAMMREKDPESFQGKGFEPVTPRNRARILAETAERTASEAAARVITSADHS